MATAHSGLFYLCEEAVQKLQIIFYQLIKADPPLGHAWIALIQFVHALEH